MKGTPSRSFLSCNPSRDHQTYRVSQEEHQAVTVTTSTYCLIQKFERVDRLYSDNIKLVYDPSGEQSIAIFTGRAEMGQSHQQSPNHLDETSL
jgi:hypothetical protein